MKRLATVIPASLVALLTACGSFQRNAPPLTNRPGNILLIIADDVGKDKIGVYDLGNDATRPATPNLDRLAARGVRFNSAYAYSVCSPTRASILTGQYGFRTGIGAVIHRQDTYVLPLYPKTVPIPIMLKLGGVDYDHSHIGKWQLATPKVGGLANALKHGFNYTAGPRGIRSYFRWPKQVNGELIRKTGYMTSDTTDDAIARANAMREPWFLWLAYTAAHKPFHVPPAHLHHQPHLGDDPALLYAAMVEALDSEIGRLLASIEPGILLQTTVIFLGDNGTPHDALRPPYNQPTKATMKEGGINVPLIVAGPPVPPESQGLVCDALVNTTDLYATMADIAGVDLSATLPAGHISDSHSILPLLERPTQGRSIRRFAYAERFKPNGPPPYAVHQQAIRDRRWKLVRDHQAYSNRSYIDQLYDLSAREDGLDGRDLCPCPSRLEGEALEAYKRLVKELEAIEGS